MRNKIKQLEQASAGLEPSAGARQAMTKLAVDYAESFLTRLPELNAFEHEAGQQRIA